MNYKRTFIIAEAGVNHNGSLKLAKKMIDAAALAGVDAVKFQSFSAEKLATRAAPKAIYQQQGEQDQELQIELLKRLELGVESHRVLFDYCRQKKVQFLSSPFDLESVDLLVEIGVKLFKIPSGEITNLPLLRKIGKLGYPIMLSTGMANMDDVNDAFQILLGSGTKKEDICILQCNTEYPTPFRDVNLKAVQTMGIAFGVDVGVSDHTPGIEVPIAAVALGAVVIEKHFTLDRKMSGPDHSASLTPDELIHMVSSIRNIEKALGDGRKTVSPSERKNIRIVRKSIVAAKTIREGELFSERNLTTKRPGTGISPMRWDEIVGTTAMQDYKQDELI